MQKHCVSLESTEYGDSKSDGEPCIIPRVGDLAHISVVKLFEGVQNEGPLQTSCGLLVRIASIFPSRSFKLSKAIVLPSYGSRYAHRFVQ